MSMIILDPSDQTAIIEARIESGADRFDEVWDGVYIVSPLPNDEHQEIVGNFTICFGIVIQLTKLGKVRPGVNVSDRVDDWEKNYRGPDVVVFLNDTAARNYGAHWVGGPDFAVEVVSRYDRSREKLDFYSKIAMRELLIVDRYPWALELYRLGEAGVLELVGRSTLERPDTLTSQVMPLTFQLIAGDERPSIATRHSDGIQNWLG